MSPSYRRSKHCRPPERFGIDLPPIPNKPYFGTIEVDELLGVVAAARLAETPLDEFLALNPAYRHPVIPGESRRPLVLPADKVAVFQRNLDALEAADKPLSTWTTYALKKGKRSERLLIDSACRLRYWLKSMTSNPVRVFRPDKLYSSRTSRHCPPHLAQVFAEPVSVLRKTCKRCKARKAAAQGRGRAAKLATRATSPRRKTVHFPAHHRPKAPKKKARATINPPGGLKASHSPAGNLLT
jgi:hypothetical protein